MDRQIAIARLRGHNYKKVSMIRRGAHDMPIIGVAVGTLARIA